MPETWRTRPIFISPTFRDMHAERDPGKGRSMKAEGETSKSLGWSSSTWICGGASSESGVRNANTDCRRVAANQQS